MPSDNRTNILSDSDTLQYMWVRLTFFVRVFTGEKSQPRDRLPVSVVMSHQDPLPRGTDVAFLIVKQVEGEVGRERGGVIRVNVQLDGELTLLGHQLVSLDPLRFQEGLQI